jgi:glutamate synthase domain-containing protein 1
LAKAAPHGTKLDQFIELLRRPESVSIKEASSALDEMQHSVRGAVAGALNKKYGLTIATEKVDSRGTVYRIQD